MTVATLLSTGPAAQAVLQAPPPVTPLPPVTSADPHFGVVQAFEASGLALNAGAKWERVPFFWNKAQPSDSADWQPDQFLLSQAQLAQELAANVQVVGQIGNPPLWVVKDGSTPKNLNLPWNDPANYWGQFVYRLAQTYAGKIDSWIIWNEPDFPKGHPLSTFAGTEEDYYRLLKTAYQAAKAANPNAKIVFAGTTYWADVNAGKPLYLQRVLEAARKIDGQAAADAGYYFDVVDLHLYSAPLDLYRVPQTYRQIMANFGISKPIWISETNAIPYDDPGNETGPSFFRATLSEQANFVIRALAMALAGGVERISLYKMVDGAVTERTPWGLMRNDGSVRPAYVAYQVAASHLANAGPITISNSNGIDFISFDRGDTHTVLLVNTAPAETKVALPWLGPRVTITNKLGVSTEQSIPPLANGDVAPLTITLAGATNGVIGGDPVFVEGTSPAKAAKPSGAPGAVYFKESGHNVAFAFLQAFRADGGLEVLGYPRTEALDLNGRTTQFFQRAVMEYHPEASGTPGEVTLRLLGSELNQGRQFAAASPGKNDPTHHFFPESGHNVASGFLKFFSNHGGAAVLGYPISEEMPDRLPDGAIHTVQYFQRGRLEFHPELSGKPGEVSLGLLGDELLRKMGWL